LPLSLVALVVLVPLSLAMALLHAPPLWVFATAAAAIIPLSGWIRRATEQVAERAAGPRHQSGCERLGGWIVVGLALSLGFLASNIALQFGAARLDAHTSALIMLSEIVFASVTSVALGAAEMTSRTLIGGALILFAAAWSALSAQ